MILFMSYMIFVNYIIGWIENVQCDGSPLSFANMVIVDKGAKE